MNKQDFENSYEMRRMLLFREFDREGRGQHISFFCKRERNQKEVSGKIFHPKEVNFEIEVDISKAFAKIQEKMMTKNKTLRKSMEKLRPYEEYDWAVLLNYLREEWKDGNRDKVLLSGKEWYMLGMNE